MGESFPTRAAQNKGPAGSGRRGQVLWGSGEERGPRPSATRPVGSIRAGSLAAIRDFDCAFVVTGFAGQRRPDTLMTGLGQSRSFDDIRACLIIAAGARLSRRLADIPPKNTRPVCLNCNTHAGILPP
jgi:hypothetical protein